MTTPALKSAEEAVAKEVGFKLYPTNVRSGGGFEVVYNHELGESFHCSSDDPIVRLWQALLTRELLLQEIREVAENAPLHSQEWMRKNKIVFKTNLSKVTKAKDAGWWEKVAFSIYIDLCEWTSRIVSLTQKERT